MILYKEKLPNDIRKIPPHIWFAWKPVWAWENEKRDRFVCVWLEKVWRTNGYTSRYWYYLSLDSE